MTRNDAERLSGRDHKIWADRVAGYTLLQLARKYELSQKQISMRLKEVRDSISQETREDMVIREVAFLDHLRREALALVDKPPIPAYSNGRPIVDEMGNQVEDHSARLAAMDRAIRVHERITKLLGLDAPARVDASVSVTEDTAVKELLERSRRIREQGLTSQPGD